MNKRVRVLVVDDSALMRKLISQILMRDSDIEVVGTAMDGAFGLKKIEDLKPDVVTLDLEMPRMDGMEMLRQITKKSKVPVIIVSALSTADQVTTISGRGVGMDVVKTVLDRLKGTISIRTTPGKGTTFHIFLPAGRGEP